MNIAYCQQALGFLLWLVARPKPDMAREYNIAASMATKCPKASAARVKQMPCHLKPTREIGLMYVRRSTPGATDPMHVFADARFAPTSSVSHGGSEHLVEGNLVTWNSRRQSNVTNSATESELVEAVDTNLQARNVALLMAGMKSVCSRSLWRVAALLLSTWLATWRRCRDVHDASASKRTSCTKEWQKG